VSADTATFVPPETITIPGETALEVLALLEGFTEVCADLRDVSADDAFDDLYNLQAGSDTLRKALPDPSNGMETPPWHDSMCERGHEIAKELRGLLRGNDTLRLAVLEEAVAALGQEVVGVFWSDEKRRWLTPKAYFADVETMSDAS
jgi:hypothetical protein